VKSDSPDDIPANVRPPKRKDGERFEAISRQLAGLGAQYLRLDALDSEGRQFRFHCRMPLGGSDAYSRPFEATAANPVAAMEEVLAAVEAWQAGRDPSSATRSARRP
jgi:hypothetical protein